MRWRLLLALAGAAWAASAGAVDPAAPAPGNAVRGKALYEARCGACHSVDEHRVGPRHRGVVGRVAGKANGYEYSDALAASQLVWTPANLERWLTDPEQVIPGQRMGYRLQQAPDRADVIAYLATLK